MRICIEASEIYLISVRTNSGEFIALKDCLIPAKFRKKLHLPNVIILHCIYIDIECFISLRTSFLFKVFISYFDKNRRIEVLNSFVPILFIAPSRLWICYVLFNCSIFLWPVKFMNFELFLNNNLLRTGILLFRSLWNHLFVSFKIFTYC